MSLPSVVSRLFSVVFLTVFFFLMFVASSDSRLVVTVSDMGILAFLATPYPKPHGIPFLYYLSDLGYG